MMNKNTTRATAIIGTTMALVIGAAAAVSAHPGDREDRGPQRAEAGMGARMGGAMLPGARDMGGRLRGGLGDLERREVTLQTADGVVTDRVEQGAVDSVADDALSFSLGSGEAVSVVIDEDTQLVAFEEQEVTARRGWSRTRLVPAEIEAADIETGAEVMVWSDSEDGAAFVASRIVVEPAAAADETTTDEAADATADPADASASDASDASVTEDASGTDA